MIKFKKGDRIRRIIHRNTETMPIGSEWIVAECGVAHVYVDGFQGYCDPSFFELVKPEPAVRYLALYNGGLYDTLEEAKSVPGASVIYEVAAVHIGSRPKGLNWERSEYAQA